ncbi:MAG: hypothetical protein AB1585_20525 [Thermodesulfobacteriota bacterium]
MIHWNGLLIGFLTLYVFFHDSHPPLLERVQSLPGFHREVP